MIKLAVLLLISMSCFSQAKKDTSVYSIKGSIDKFEIVFKAVQTSRDITPNEADSVIHWINKNLELDNPPEIKKSPKK